MFQESAIRKEIAYRTSRSSGSGGQHVNKVETRVEAIFDFAGSPSLSEIQKQAFRAKYGKRINGSGELVVASSEHKSQAQNRSTATEKLIDLLKDGLKKKRIRKSTSIPKSINEKRLERKKLQSEKKQRRGFQP